MKKTLASFILSALLATMTWIQASGQCAPGFSFTASNLQVSFTDTSSGVPTSWYWDFGDGNSSIMQNPTHTYAAAGSYTTCLTVTDSCGTDSVCHTTTVTCNVPDPGFSFSATNLQVSYTDTSSGAPTSWLWDFGDGNISTQQNPTHTFLAVGSYTTCLTVTNSCGTDSVCHTTTVTCPVPDPGFSFSATNLQVSFTDTSSGSPTSWFWDFGDGNTSTQQNPTHTYAFAGSYTTCLTVTNSCGTDSVCHTTTVACPMPDPGFSFTATNLQVSYTDTSSGAPTSWLWDFGDGNISTQQNPTHTFLAVGSYTTCLTVTNSCGSDSVCHTTSVACPVPDPGFSFMATNLQVSYTDTSSGAPTSWLWDFGDGNISTQQNPTHTYAVAGSYTTCLTVTNSCGTDSVCHTTTVACPMPDPGFSFTATNLQVSYTDTSSGAPTSWLWDFGDGNISTQQNPTHTFAVAGSYTTCLTVTNSCGTDSVCHTTTVACPVPDPGFSFTATNLQVSYTDTSSGAPTSWLWDFGDGNISTQQNPTHTYAVAGGYTTCLTVTNSCGTDSVCHTTTVACPVPDPGFSFTATNLQVSFMDTSSGAPTSWLWDFGDGNISTQQNPTHTYAVAGSYTTCLTVTNSCGTDSVCHNIRICEVLVAGFNINQTDTTVMFTDTSSGSPVSWLWDFGDGNTSTQQNPSHVYAANGTYLVCLTVTDNCVSDSSCANVVIQTTSTGMVPAQPMFSIYPNPGHGRFTLRLHNADPQDYTLEVYDLQGKRLFTKSVYRANGEISLSPDLAPGLYRLSVIAADGSAGNVALVIVE